MDLPSKPKNKNNKPAAKRIHPRGLMYMRHREKVLNATSYIDSSSPQMMVGNVVKFSKEKGDADQHDKTMKANIRMFVGMNTIMRSHGRLKTFRTFALQPSNLRSKINKLKVLEETNLRMGHRVLCTKGEVGTRRPLSDAAKRQQLRGSDDFKLPNHVLAKYGPLELPGDVKVLRRLLRPRIYFNLAITGNRPLGRFVVQLYTEACPQVVLEFVRICKTQDTGRLQIIHLFPNLWLEGELKLMNRQLNTPKIEYDMRAIDHGQSSGVLSFARRHLRGFVDGVLDFAISFKPLSVLNGKRVAFGRVMGGHRILDSLQEYGTKNGKPVKNIVVVGCGAL